MIKVGFITLTLSMAGLVFLALQRLSSGNQLLSKRNLPIRWLAAFAAWFLYIFFISGSGILATTSLPPRIPLLLILPCFLFMIWFFRSASNKPLVNAAPAAWLIYPQVFRVAVELLLHALADKGIIPHAGTFEGYNYEIVVAFFAPVVGYLRFTKKMLPLWVATVWNMSGLATLAVVVFIMLSHVYLPGIYSKPEPLSISDFGSFPYTLLAGFLMPLAVFLHIFAIIRIRRAGKAAG